MRSLSLIALELPDLPFEIPLCIEGCLGLLSQLLDLPILPLKLLIEPLYLFHPGCTVGLSRLGYLYCRCRLEPGLQILYRGFGCRGVRT